MQLVTATQALSAISQHKLRGLKKKWSRDETERAERWDPEISIKDADDHWANEDTVKYHLPMAQGLFFFFIFLKI